jgi:diguanylate cyclase (GGDEF)-like protein
MSSEGQQLETFEREYTIENFTQRDLMLDLGAVLWFISFGMALAAGRIDDAPESTAQGVVRLVIALTSAAIAVAFLTLVRKLDDERTTQVVAVTIVVGIVFQYILSSYGPGALGGMVVAMVGATIYAAQFLGLRGVTVMLVLVSVFSGLSVHDYYGSPEAPYFLSQTVLLVIILWGVGYSVYALKQDRARALAEAEDAAFSDPLTGLPNTRQLRRRATALLDSRNERINRQTGVIVLDLDGFRAANMLRGHRYGDRLLRAVARGAEGFAKPGHIVARTGSDEFSVLIPDTTSHDLGALGDAYRAAVLDSIDREADHGVSIDASVGVALSGEDGDSFETLMRSADQSMYLVKAAHERRSATRRVPLETEVDDDLPWVESGARIASPPSRWNHLRWSNRPMQVKFAASSWLLSAFAVAAAMAVPDAYPHSSTAVTLIVMFGLIMTVSRYVTRPSVHLAQQLLDVLIASVALAVAMHYSGKSASAATPIELLILIYIGWFLPLKWVVPSAAASVLIVLGPLFFDTSNKILLLDAVTLIGGIVVSAALLVVLYYNHFYLERARKLTDELASLDPRAATNNRRAFEERMREELDGLSYGDRDQLAVVMIDLGNFKSVSANYGRTIGDQMLTEVASALTAASREEDCVARLGGDEFAIVAPGVDAESARALAQRLVDAVREALEVTDLPSNEEVRPSAGFALYGMHGRTTDELVTAADIALTAAKTSGRDPNRVSSFVVAL